MMETFKTLVNVTGNDNSKTEVCKFQSDWIYRTKSQRGENDKK